MPWRTLAVLLLIAPACVESQTEPCGDAVCPEGMRCAQVMFMDREDTLCVRPDQLTSCAGMPERAACTVEGAPATCHDEVCLADACGNGLRDALEACDDGGTRSGDGCSSDCRSTETCGNGILDPVRISGEVSTLGELCDDGAHLAHDGCNSSCESEAVTVAELRFDTPVARGQHAMAYDVRRDRVVMFGGFGTAALGETWTWDGHDWGPAASVVTPPLRMLAAMAYDARRERTVMFGGADLFSNSGYGDTWEWDGARWVERTVASSPPARSEHAMAYDAKRRRVVLFGGAGAGLLADTWEWDGTTWTPITTGSSPPAVRGAALAYDPVRGNVVLFGGSAGGPLPLAETWIYNGTTWSKATPTMSPPPRQGAVMAWDAAGGRIILFGGNGAALLADTWAWNGTQWQPLTTTGAPAARKNAGLVPDAGNAGLVLFGGLTSGGAIGDTWRWAGSTWTKADTYARPHLAGAAASVDLDRHRVVAFGSSDGSSFLSLTAELINGRWISFPAATGPGSRVSAAMAYDPLRKVSVLFGGVLGSELTDGTWTWNGSSWTHAAATGNPPPRQGHQMVFDRDAGEIVMFGGKTGSTALADTWTWSGTQWMQRSPQVTPPARSFHALGYDPVRKVTVVFGGRAQDGSLLRDVWERSAGQWTMKTPATGPAARQGAQFAWNPARKRLMLIGGTNGQLDTRDTWEWDGTTWQPISELSLPPRRDAIALPTVDGDGVLVLGGVLASGLEANDARVVSWRSPAPDESCRDKSDRDQDGLAGCDDPDCWSICSPRCEPGLGCDASAPRCGDSVCNADLESCRLCPECGPCAVICGDFVCDPSESPASCPGDCP